MTLEMIIGLLATMLAAIAAAFGADDGEIILEYTGLIAYSESLEHDVLQLND